MSDPFVVALQRYWSRDLLAGGRGRPEGRGPDTPMAPTVGRPRGHRAALRDQRFEY